MGSGINTTFRQVGIATGVAALGAIFQSQVNSKLAELLPNAPKGLGEIVSSGGTEAALRVTPGARHAEVAHASTVAFVSGFNEIILIAAILSFLGAALGFALVRARDFVQQTEPAPEPAAA
jgi:small basic protein